MDRQPTMLGQHSPKHSPSVATAAIALCSGIAACGGSSPVAPTPSTSGDFPLPATHRIALPDGGELVARFSDFHPARGARLVSGQGAYVRVQWEMPRRAVLVSAAGDAWDGTRALSTSFMSSNILFAFPVCTSDPPTLLTRNDQFGRAAHPRFEFPRAGDPDVPFVRVRLWITDWPHGCDGNLPDPRIAEIQASTPALTAIERVDWRRP
jgi:hypothetical protein